MIIRKSVGSQSIGIGPGESQESGYINCQGGKIYLWRVFCARSDVSPLTSERVTKEKQ